MMYICLRPHLIFNILAYLHVGQALLNLPEFFVAGATAKIVENWPESSVA
jgi:hypothetical protein